MLVLALIGLAVGLTAFQTTNLINAFSAVRPEETLRTAMREARYLAFDHREDMHLTYDEESATFFITAASGGQMDKYETGFAAGEDTLAVTFLRREPTEPSVFAIEPETNPVPFIRFAADRSATPVDVVLSFAGSEVTLSFDPFSDTIFIDPEP